MYEILQYVLLFAIIPFAVCAIFFVAGLFFVYAALVVKCFAMSVEWLLKRWEAHDGS